MENDIFDLIKQLELSLLDYELRSSKAKLDKLIDDEFIEIGSSGKIYNKTYIIDNLPNEYRRNFKAFNFNLIYLSKNSILITYQTIENSVNTLRSSIWRKLNGSWKIIFHQGTKKYEY